MTKIFKEIGVIIKNDENENGNSETDSARENKLLNTSRTNEEHNQHKMTEGTIHYLAGWVAKKYKLKHLELGWTTTELNQSSTFSRCDYCLPSWINRLSYGGVIVSSDNFHQIIIRCERLFKKTTKN